MSGPVDDLLAKLCSGDVAAAERVFVAFEPYLRKAVRRQLSPALRAKFDSADVVQSVWVDLLRGFRQAGWRFADADQLRGFLFVATRNRLIDRIRQYERVIAREQPLPVDEAEPCLISGQPRPSETAQATELWERILSRCPVQHRPILGLRRQGYSLVEIAARTGAHPDTVRRVLRTLARKFAFDSRAAREASVSELA